MRLSRNLLLSWELLISHRLRTLLSVLGVVVGVAAVVLTVSAGKGAEHEILERVRQMGTDLIVVSAGQTRIIAGRQRQMATVTTLVPEDAESIASSCPSVARAAAAADKNVTVRWESETANTKVLGADVGALDIRNVRIAAGRTFDAREVRGKRRVAVLGPTVVENLFGTVDPVGLRVRINRVPFEVIGVTAAKGVDAGGVDQDDLAYVPLTAAMRRLLNVDYVNTIFVQAKSSDVLHQAEEEVRELLRKRHRLGNRPDDFTIQNQATLLETERTASESLTMLIGGVAGISLLVGGVGILAVMLMSVRERTPEIGLRRAVGATRGDVRTQFIVESAVLSGAGGLIGVALGLAAALIAAAMGYWHVLISWTAVGVGLVFSIGLGIAFGSYPAHRAAELDPITALRAE
ncbi:MAG: ABC transporter permease [Phycisphaerae bacterium]|nr:ABC transporter permease [Phycisphaerae bacterium]